VGQIACLSEGSLALSISRGGAPKRYAYRDPNEDAAGFAHGPGGLLLAVADGHGGHEASELAVQEGIAFGAEWLAVPAPEEPWDHAAARLVAHVHDVIRSRGVSGGNPESRTTLSIALVRPAEAWWGWVSVGDSHVFRIAADEVAECGPQEGKLLFMGAPMREADELGLRCGHEHLPGVRGLALSSDGLSERGIGVADPPDAVARAVAEGERHTPARRPIESARALAEIAQESHRSHDAGDNIACAFWLPRS
jgi:serine/threonine protein phosphatase PrpC